MLDHELDRSRIESALAPTNGSVVVEIRVPSSGLSSSCRLAQSNIAENLVHDLAVEWTLPMDTQSAEESSSRGN